jgi:hypothetical protein
VNAPFHLIWQWRMRDYDTEHHLANQEAEQLDRRRTPRFTERGSKGDWNNTHTTTFPSPSPPLFRLLYHHRSVHYLSNIATMDTAIPPAAKPELKDAHGLETPGNATADVVDLEQKFGYLQELPRVGDQTTSLAQTLTRRPRPSSTSGL